MRGTRYMPCFAQSCGKCAQIALSAPIKLALDLLVMNPDTRRWLDIDPGGLHLEDFVFPLRSRIAREVKFAHHRQPRLSVAESDSGC